MATNLPAKRPTLRERIVSALFGNRITAEVSRRVDLAVRAVIDATDRLVTSGKHTEGWRDRYSYNREQIITDALAAWRDNPLARRIVSLTTQYVVGGGITVESKHPGTNQFIKLWWEHRLNHMPIRVFEWCDELTRSGEIFPLLSTDERGMTFIRAVPAADIDDIETAPNDVEQPTRFIGKQDITLAETPTYTAYDEPADDGISAVMLHYAINRPVAAKRGESDLAPLTRWLSRYAAWLEDRVRLNHWRQIFVWVVSGKFSNAAERIARQAEITANPPSPGSVMVKDESEVWEALSPKLDAFEAEKDGLTLKKMIAVGAGVPPHFLAEPESSTRTTAESAGGPTFRHYQQRQLFFLWLIKDLAQIAVRRRARVDRTVQADAEIIVRGTDISARDNAALANAASTIGYILLELYDRGIIDEKEIIKLCYTFAGEMVDLNDLLKRITKPRAAPIQSGNGHRKPTSIIEPETGDTKEPA